MSMPNPEQKSFFIDRPEGTGKSFPLEQILVAVRYDRKIAIAVASSEIASLLLMGGRPAHSMFEVSLQATKDSTCSMSKQSAVTELIREASLVIWDEAPMAHRHSFKALDRSLRVVLDNEDEPFGGEIIILSRDFHQIRPVVKRGGMSETIDACLKKSDLWPLFKTLALTENMRVQTAPNPQAGANLAIFSMFLLEVGEGRHEKNTSLGSDYMKIPQDLLISEACDEPENELAPRMESIQGGDDSDDEEDAEEQSDLTKLIDAIYADVNSQMDNDAYFAERAILTPTNTDVRHISDEVTKRLSGEAREYLSHDVVEDETEDDSLYEKEFLNSLSIFGIPPHRLILKVGSPIMVMRNLNSDIGLYNGTRLRVVELRNNCIWATIMTGSRNGQQVFIPRVVLISSEGEHPFQLRRKQSPIVPAFAVAISKLKDSLCII